jgi:hypothetical protein
MREFVRQWRLSLLLLSGAVGFALLSPYLFFAPAASSPGTAQGAAGGRRHYDMPPMVLEVPPIDRPVLVHAADARIDDAAIIIGVVVQGEARAYLRDAFALGPLSHIVRDKIQATPIAVTHCDRLLCTRVFAGNDPNRPLNIRVSGWRSDQTMELVIDGKQYSQKFPILPLAELPFSEATWGQWRKKYPDTLIYLGGNRNT